MSVSLDVREVTTERHSDWKRHEGTFWGSGYFELSQVFSV